MDGQDGNQDNPFDQAYYRHIANPTVPETIANHGLDLTPQATQELTANGNVPPEKELTPAEIDALSGAKPDLSTLSLEQRIKAATGVSINMRSDATLKDQK